MLCPKCEGEDCIHIEIRLSGEDRVQFYSCRKCESKWWERDGDTVASSSKPAPGCRARGPDHGVRAVRHFPRREIHG